MYRQDIAEQATQAAATTGAAISTANCIAIFSMFVLQDLMMQQLVNPVNNFNNIVALAGAIATLNASVKPIP